MTLLLRIAAARQARLLGLLAGFLPGALLAQAPAATPVATALADASLVAATDELLREAEAFGRLPASARAAAQARLVQLAERRKALLLAQLQRSPQQVASRLLPDAVRARLPAAVQAQLETTQATSGQAFALIEDHFDHGHSQSQLMLQADGQARPWRLHLADTAAGPKDSQGWVGRRLQLRGSRLGEDFIVTDRREVALLAANGSVQPAMAAKTMAATASAVQGVQNTLVILTDFSDKPLACSSADVATRVFGATGATVNRNHVESSQGLVSFTGRVIGPFSIPFSSTGSCDFLAWGEAAEAAALAAGVNPAAYDRVNYLVAGNTTCGWTGIAYVPGRRSWVNRCESTGTISHELGHNLGFLHAKTPAAEYGDASDPMGAARLVQHNAANRVMAGWLAGSAVVDVASGGSYSLAPLELVNPGTPQVLRVPKPDTGEAYYLSLRQAINLDASLAAPYVNTLSVHRALGELPSSPTTLLASLAVGQTYADAANGLAFTLQGLSGGLATVAVSQGGNACVRATPALSLNPASQSGNPGSSQNYVLTVTNRNSSACGSAGFDLSTVLPTGFSATLAASRLTLAPGSSGSTNVAVTSPANASAATYSFSLRAADAGLASNSATVQGAYLVNATSACVRAAPNVSLSPSSKTGSAGSRQYFTAVVANRNSAGCGSGNFQLSLGLPTGFSGVFTSPTVAVAPGGKSTMSLSLVSPASAAPATYAFTVRAADALAPSSQGSAAGGYVVAGSSCVRAAPTLWLVPSLKTGIAGSRQYYTPVLTNRNSSGCGTGTFDLNATLPGGFTGAFTTTRLTVAPGATANTSMSVLSPLSAAAANHVFTVKAVDAASPTSQASQASVQATFAVVKDSTAPTVAWASPAPGATLLKSAGTVALSATASDAYGLARVEFWRNGSLLGSDVSSPYAWAWNLASEAPGSHVLEVRAYDASGNSSRASLTVTVQ